MAFSVCSTPPQFGSMTLSLLADSAVAPCILSNSLYTPISCPCVSNPVYKSTLNVLLVRDESIIAGGNGYGFEGDGGLATDAKMGSVNGVVLDSLGNIYIGDRGNNRIRKVDVNTSNISTIAGTGVAGFSGDGGAATSAQLNEPCRFSIDSDDNLYFCDKNNY